MPALLWLALLLPDFGARYSFGWDSSQFDRGAKQFDIARHQPHPPGYPLWVLAIRGITPVLGNPNRAQVFLAMLFTLGGLWFFSMLSRELLGDRAGLSATLLLAFSPVTCLYANSSQVYAVELFTSCFAGWLARELWSGKTARAIPGFAVLALAGGFRPSAPVAMAPLLALALWRSGLRKPGLTIAGVAVGTICWLAWLTPTALMTGGFGALSALNHDQAVRSFAGTSVFFGAPAIAHFHMAVDTSVYLAVAAAGWLPLLVASLRRPKASGQPPACWATPVFFTAWMGPNLALVYLLHCSQPGYVLSTVPPMVLILARFCRRALGSPAWTAAGIAAALLVSWFPYERFLNPRGTALPYLLLRAGPRMSRVVESSQRELRLAIDRLPGSPEPKRLVCLRNQFEAPNIRTVTYDFSDVAWAGPSDPATPLPPAGWLCDGAGLPAELRRQYPQARRIAGNGHFSFWTAP